VIKMDTLKNKKLNDYSDLSQEAQETIKSRVERVITEKGIDWQAFEDIQHSEDKCGPPRYATNEIFDKLEESRILSLKEGYGAYALQAGSLINLGPKRNIFSKYNFSEMEELQRYVEACYDGAQYQIVAVAMGDILPTRNR